MSCRMYLKRDITSVFSGEACPRLQNFISKQNFKSKTVVSRNFVCNLKKIQCNTQREFFEEKKIYKIRASVPRFYLTYYD